ncbi:MAG: hypothetical protein WKF75_01155 [Singulisphaera sp.]
MRNLLEYPIGDIHLMRGVGYRTRREIIDYLTQPGRFPASIRPGQGPARTGRARGRRPWNGWSTGSSGSDPQEGRRARIRTALLGWRRRNPGRRSTGPASPTSPRPWTSPEPEWARW